jgi:prolyl oligopeptidase
VDFTENMFGTLVDDPYRWLEENNEKVDKWVDSQNDFTRSYLDRVKDREVINSRMLELYDSGVIHLPVKKGNRLFFRERKPGEEQSVIYYQEGLTGEPKVLLDPNIWEGTSFKSLQGYEPSFDGKLLAYRLSKKSNDAASFHILNIDGNFTYTDVIPDKFYPHFLTWNVDNSGFWYARSPEDVPKGEERYHMKVYYHKIGTDWKNDELVFGKDFVKEDVPWEAVISKDGHWLLVGVFRPLKGNGEYVTELYLKNLVENDSEFKPVVENASALFYGRLHRNKIYITTNHNAPLWKIMSVDVKYIGQGVDAWETVIPEGEHVISDFKLVGDHLVVEYNKNASTDLRVYNLSGDFLSQINLPTIGSAGFLQESEEGNGFFFSFESFFFPDSIYRYDLLTKSYKLHKRLMVDVKPNDFELKQVWYKSKDGTKVPMFVFHKKGIKLDGKNPTLLYGYGGFQISILPSFYKSRMVFLENGGVYAVANIRGGGEFGKKWHDAGRLEKKQNTFDDFIAAAEWLIENMVRATEGCWLALF